MSLWLDPPLLLQLDLLLQPVLLLHPVLQPAFEHFFAALSLQEFLPLHEFAPLQELFPLQEFALLQELFSIFLPQPLALQPFEPEPAKAGAAENAPTAKIPAKATVASFLFIGFF